MIDHLQSKTGSHDPVIYFFYDYKRRQEQRLGLFVAALLRQLASLSQAVFSAVEELYRRLEPHGQRPLLNDLQSRLRNAFQKVARVSVVIDAWDECEALTRVKCADTLRDCRLDCVTRLFVTTRDDHEVQALFTSEPVLRIEADIEDLRLYIESRVAELIPDIHGDIKLVEEVIKGVIDASEHM